MSGAEIVADRLHISGTMLTHVGLVRTSNEDVVAYVTPRQTDPSAALDLFALVADGMGGHAAGEVASRMAADIMLARIGQTRHFTPHLLLAAIDEANLAILAESRSDPARAGMGTTCTAVAVRDGALYLAHVGDSRAYLVRGGIATQISLDHSLVADMVRRGILTEAEAEVSADRHVITQALGQRESASPDIFVDGLALKRCDVIVLCSDGLSDLLPRAVIADAVTAAKPDDAAAALMAAALAAGGHDNISVGVFAVSAEPSPAARASRTTASWPVMQDDPEMPA